MTQTLIDAAAAGGLYLVIAIGFRLQYEAAPFFNFTFASLISFGGLAVWSVARIVPIPFPLQAAAVAVAGGLLMMAIASLFFVAALRDRRSPLALLLISFGGFLALQGFWGLVWGPNPRILDGAPTLITLGATRLTAGQLAMLLGGIALVVVVESLRTSSRKWSLLKAAAESPDLLSAFGSSPRCVWLGTFFLSGAIAASVGLLMILDTEARPSMGLQVFLLGVIPAALTRGRSFLLTALFCLLLGVAQHAVITFGAPGWDSVVVFGLLAVGVISLAPRKQYS